MRFWVERYKTELDVRESEGRWKMVLSYIHLIFIDDEHNTDDDCGKCGSMWTVGRNESSGSWASAFAILYVSTASVVLIQQRIVSAPVTRKPAETFTRYVNNNFFFSSCTRAILTIEFGY